MNDLMTVILLSNDIKEFDHKDTIEIWLTSGLRQRRPTFMDEESSQDEDIVYVGLANIEQHVTDCKWILCQNFLG